MMSYRRKLSNNINTLQKKYFRIIYSDNTSSYNKILKNIISFITVNIQVLAREIYKVVKCFLSEASQ